MNSKTIGPITVLEYVGLNEFEAHEAEKAFYKYDQHAMRHLARLWDPDKPVYENEAYVARAKELEQELDSTMLSTRTGEALDDNETQSEEGKAEG